MKASNVKLSNLVVGVIVLAFAALLLVDAILTTYNPDHQLFSPNDVKGIVGMILIVSRFIFPKNQRIDKPRSRTRKACHLVWQPTGKELFSSRTFF